MNQRCACPGIADSRSLFVHGCRLDAACLSSTALANDARTCTCTSTYTYLTVQRSPPYGVLL